MRICLWGLALALAFLVSFNPPREAKASSLLVLDYAPDVYHNANRISKFFRKKGCASKEPCGNPQWILAFTAQQMYWLIFFRIEHTAEKFLSNTAAESWYDPRAVSSAGCIGATQVCSIELADNILRQRGIDVCNLKASQLDAARGVSIYWWKLKKTNGEPWEAIQRYNGAGKAAVAHRNKVWKYHREIFG